MACTSGFSDEEKFLCALCLELFSHPVSTPCGHNYCKACITQYWDISDVCNCPMCQECFTTRPKLKVNTIISEIVSEFTRSTRVTGQLCTKKGDIPCDACNGMKLKAVKACLMCVLSYCETHLEPHQRIERLKQHRLIDPVENLEDRMCKKHDRPLEMFCKTDDVCVCQFCSEAEHKLHQVIPLEKRCEEEKAELKQTETEVQQMIQERQQKIQDLQQSVKLSKVDADREIADNVRFFNALVVSIGKCQDKLITSITEKQKLVENKAEDFIRQLEQEIDELTQRCTEVEQMLQIEDHLHLIQKISLMNPPPLTKEWTKVKFERPFYVRAVVRIWDELQQSNTTELMKIDEADLKRMQQQDAVDVTLDHETVHPSLILSADGKKVHYGGGAINIPGNPERFSTRLAVLGVQSISSGRFYYEVQTTGKTFWCVGVVKKSINRKAVMTTCPQNGMWVLCLTNEDTYIVNAQSFAAVPAPQKVGVFIDYDGGMVSFYNVETRSHIYSFSGYTFTEPLCPYLCPCSDKDGKNCSPLTINPVNQTD